MMEWIDNRWHVDGRGIHAGDMMELQCGGRWILVRVESKDCGCQLYAHLQLDTPLERFCAISRIVTPAMVDAIVAGRVYPRDHYVEFPDGTVDALRWPEAGR